MNSGKEILYTRDETGEIEAFKPFTEDGTPVLPCEECSQLLVCTPKTAFGHGHYFCNKDCCQAWMDKGIERAKMARKAILEAENEPPH